MAAASYVFTIRRVAKMLNENEDRFHELALEMEPEDGCLTVWGTGDRSTTAFTSDGLEYLRQPRRRAQKIREALPSSLRHTSPAVLTGCIRASRVGRTQPGRSAAQDQDRPGYAAANTIARRRLLFLQPLAIEPQLADGRVTRRKLVAQSDRC